MSYRILSVVSYFYPHRGGAEQQALLCAAELQRQGLTVGVLTRHFPGLPLLETIKGVPVHRAIYTMPWGKLFGISYFFSCLWFFIKNRHSYDIIQCYILQGFHCLAAIVMKYLFEKKIIIRVSATGPLSDFLLLQQGLGGGFFLRLVRKADKIIVLCNQSQQETLAAGFHPQQIMYIPNAVDTAFFTPAHQPPAARKILFVGRLDQMKGVDILLKAIAELKQTGISAACTIIGDGHIKEDLQIRSRALAIDDRVVFLGACSDIVSHLQQASIFVLPSYSEGVPNVLIEAMACGLPVIATSVGGIPDIIQDGRNGLLVPPGDAPALSSALQRLMANADFASCLGEQARRDVEKCYALEKITAKYIALYEVLLPPT